MEQDAQRRETGVWIARADGSGARQFTQHAYGWSSPSEADNGTVVVAGGLARVNPGGTDSDGSSELYRFRPDGNQIGGATPTWGSYSSPACVAYPPTSVRVSPDASRIAYGIYSCGDFGHMTALWTPAGPTGLDFPNQHLGQQDYTEPAWIDSTRFTISHSGPPLGTHLGEHYVGDGDNTGSGWLESQSPMDDETAHAVISRTGQEAVVLFEDAASWTDGKPRDVRLVVYRNPSMPSDFNAGYGDPVCNVPLSAAQTPDVHHLSPTCRRTARRSCGETAAASRSPRSRPARASRRTCWSRAACSRSTQAATSSPVPRIPCSPAGRRPPRLPPAGIRRTPRPCRSGCGWPSVSARPRCSSTAWRPR